MIVWTYYEQCTQMFINARASSNEKYIFNKLSSFSNTEY